MNKEDLIKLEKHLILISRSLNKTKIMTMKKHKNHHRKFKRYWKLIFESREDLDVSKWKKFTYFNHLMTESNVVKFLINLDDELNKLIYFSKIYYIHLKTKTILY